MDDLVLKHDPATADNAAPLSPRSDRLAGCYLVAGYMVLFLLRPWEILVPALATIHLERHYALLTIAVVLLSAGSLRWTGQCWLVSLFTAAVAGSALFAWQPALCWAPLYRFLTVVVSYFLIRAVCRAPRDLFLMLLVYVATMWLYLSKALWEYFVHGRHEVAQGVSRLLGIEETYGEPNALAMSVVVSLPLWYWCWRQRHTLVHDCSRGARAVVRWGLASYPVLATVAVLLTNSRAGMLGLACLVILIRLRRGSWWRMVNSAVIGLLLIAMLWLVAPEEQKDRLRTVWNPSAGPSNAYASALGRWHGLCAGLEMLERFPMTGVGIGNFLQYRVFYLDGVPKIAHSLPGQILGELGLIGGIAFLGMVGATWSAAGRVQRIEASRPDAAALADLGGAIRTTILLMFLFGLSLHNGLRFNWLWLAAFASLAWEFAGRGMIAPESSNDEPTQTTTWS